MFKKVGIIGIDINGNTRTRSNSLAAYKLWRSMLSRCYDTYKRKYYNYIDCTVCEEWHNFQNFAKWYENNYYKIEGIMMNLDKDILIKGNKVYNPETCMFVPQNVNVLFTKSNKIRGLYPIGVSLYRGNKYKSTCSDGKGKSLNLGYFITIDDAFDRYKSYKEKLIKDIANGYKDKIPTKLYDAMMEYTVDIKD